jgi:hypothetical protein
MIYIILTILKVIVCLVGFTFAAINFIAGIKGDKRRLKKAVVIFLVILMILILITAIELAMIKA